MRNCRIVIRFYTRVPRYTIDDRGIRHWHIAHLDEAASEEFLTNYPPQPVPWRATGASIGHTAGLARAEFA